MIYFVGVGHRLLFWQIYTGAHIVLRASSLATINGDEPNTFTNQAEENVAIQDVKYTCMDGLAKFCMLKFIITCIILFHMML